MPCPECNPSSRDPERFALIDILPMAEEWFELIGSNGTLPERDAEKIKRARDLVLRILAQ